MLGQRLAVRQHPAPVRGRADGERTVRTDYHLGQRRAGAAQLAERQLEGTRHRHRHHRWDGLDRGGHRAPAGGHGVRLEQRVLHARHIGRARAGHVAAHQQQGMLSAQHQPTLQRAH